MDPISAAGISISVASFCLQIFAGCIFIEAKDMPASFQYLRVRLRIEQTRLLNWGQKVGLVEELIHKPSRVLGQNRNLIIDILLEVQALFRECTAIEDKQNRMTSLPFTKLRVGGSRGEKGNADGAAQTHQRDAGFDRRFPRAIESFLEKTLNVLDRTTEVPDRLLWSMIRKERFEDLVHKLIDYNTAIEAILDNNSLVQLQHLQQQTHMALLQLNSGVAELREVSRALQVNVETKLTPKIRGSQNAAAITTTMTSVATERRDSNNAEKLSTQSVDVARLVDFKAKQIQIESQSSSFNIQALKPGDITITTNNATGSRSLAKYQDRNDVWIEWKHSSVDLVLHPRWKDMIEHRIKKLVLLLQEQSKLPLGFNAPQCLGYFYEGAGDGQEGEHHSDDDGDDRGQRFGILYCPPPAMVLSPLVSVSQATFTSIATTTKPVSLLEVIKAHQRESRPLPSLTKRVRLAHSITRSLMYIHSVNWIHKGLRSNNIIFAWPANNSERTKDDDLLFDDITNLQPLIAGFEYARPDVPVEETEPPPDDSEYDIYRRPLLPAPHPPPTPSGTVSNSAPSTLALRSQKSHDIYALGIILVEIAHWRPIHAIMEVSESQRDKRAARARIRDVRRLLLQPRSSYMATIEGLMGGAYTDAVRRCLTGGAELGIPEHAVDESDPEVSVKLQETFARQVVDRLGDIRI